MKTKRKAQTGPVAARVISLEAYRRARSEPPAAAPERDSVIVEAYCSWLALAGAFWAFWW